MKLVRGLSRAESFPFELEAIRGYLYLNNNSQHK